MALSMSGTIWTGVLLVDSSCALEAAPSELWLGSALVDKVGPASGALSIPGLWAGPP